MLIASTIFLDRIRAASCSMTIRQNNVINDSTRDRSTILYFVRKITTVETRASTFQSLGRVSSARRENSGCVSYMEFSKKNFDGGISMLCVGESDCGKKEHLVERVVRPLARRVARLRRHLAGDAKKGGNISGSLVTLYRNENADYRDERHTMHAIHTRMRNIFRGPCARPDAISALRKEGLSTIAAAAMH